MSRNVDRCFDELRPVCQQLERLVTSAPLTSEELRDLSARIAAYYFGVAIRIAKRVSPELADIPDPEFTRFIGEQIANLMERDGKALSS